MDRARYGDLLPPPEEVPGTQPPLLPPPPQSQLQGGHSLPEAQPGQAQVQPSELLSFFWQTPERHGAPVWQGMPSAIQAHWFAESLVQVAEST